DPFCGGMFSSTAIARGPACGPLLRGRLNCACIARPPIKTAASASAPPAGGTIRVRFPKPGRALMQVNDKAPDFTLQDKDAKSVSLRDFKGKNVVLYFFPKADTPG